MNIGGRGGWANGQHGSTENAQGWRVRAFDVGPSLLFHSIHSLHANETVAGCVPLPFASVTFSDGASHARKAVALECVLDRRRCRAVSWRRRRTALAKLTFIHSAISRNDTEADRIQIRGHQDKLDIQIMKTTTLIAAALLTTVSSIAFAENSSNTPAKSTTSNVQGNGATLRQQFPPTSSSLGSPTSR